MEININKSKLKLIKLLGITSDALKLASVLCFRGTMNVRFSRSKLIARFMVLWKNKTDMCFGTSCVITTNFIRFHLCLFAFISIYI